MIENAIQKTDVANTKKRKCRAFYGADNGSNDKPVTAEVSGLQKLLQDKNRKSHHCGASVLRRDGGTFCFVRNLLSLVMSGHFRNVFQFFRQFLWASLIHPHGPQHIIPRPIFRC